VFEQQKPDHELGILPRPADVGKPLSVFVLQILLGDELRDPEPAVPFIKLAAEGKKFGKKRLCFSVFRSIHGLRLLRKVHGFRERRRDSRALWALNSPMIYHRTFV
jgi:hypothetical protein